LAETKGRTGRRDWCHDSLEAGGVVLAVGFGSRARHAAGMQLETGGRFTVRLSEHDEHQASFQVELATPAGQWSTQASVVTDTGNVRWSTWAGGGEPPEWLCLYARAALRTAWRQHREQGWPRRLTRWRDMPKQTRAREGDLDE